MICLKVAYFGTLRKTMAVALIGAAAWSAFGPTTASARNADSSVDLIVLPAAAKGYRPIKTAWADLDFRGAWPIDHLNLTLFQRKPEQDNLAGRSFDSPMDFDSWDRREATAPRSTMRLASWSASR